MEKTKKELKKIRSLRTASLNLFLNIINFFLFVIIVFIIYSIYLKLSNSKISNSYNSEQFPSEIIQTEVLNGCNTAGVADRFTEFLRNKGIDVVNIGNYINNDVDETIIIDRRGNKANAYKIAEILGVAKSNVIQQLNENYFLDVTVIIGKDYYNLKPLK